MFIVDLVLFGSGVAVCWACWRRAATVLGGVALFGVGVTLAVGVCGGWLLFGVGAPPGAGVVVWRRHRRQGWGVRLSAAADGLDSGRLLPVGVGEVCCRGLAAGGCSGGGEGAACR